MSCKFICVLTNCVAYSRKDRGRFLVDGIFDSPRVLRIEKKQLLFRTILTREEVEDGKNLKDFDDPTLRQLNHAIEFSFIQETLTKGLNLIASGCVPSSPRSMYIIALWVISRFSKLLLMQN